MCNCMSRGESNYSKQCGDSYFSLGPSRATSTLGLPANTGAIIPFSSGHTPIILKTLIDGLVDRVSAIGFGSNVSGIPLVGNTINLPWLGGETEAFSVPRAGKITAISAAFTKTVGLTVVGNATIRAQVYRATAGSNTFVATNAFVDLAPTLTGIIATGTTYEATANIANVPVAAGDRLVMVFSVSGTGIKLAVTLTGAASAGIIIS